MTLRFEPEEQGFDVGQLNPFQIEEGTDDPDRVSLLDTFGQEGFGSGVKRLVQMVTPQSMWGSPSPGSIASDLVEFSPIGDVRDAYSAFKAPGLDPLERGLGIASALPLLGGSMRFAAQSNLNQRLMTLLRARGRELAGGELTLGSMVEAAAYHEVSRRVPEEDRIATEGWSSEDHAVLADELAKNAEIRKALNDDMKFVATSSIPEMADVISPYDSSQHEFHVLAANLRTVGEILVDENPEVFAREIDGHPADREQLVLEAAQAALLTYSRVADAGLLFREGERLSGNITDLAESLATFKDGGAPALTVFQITGVVKALAEQGIGPDLAPSVAVNLLAVDLPAELENPMADRVGGAAGDRVRVFTSDGSVRRRKLRNPDGSYDTKPIEEVLYGVDWRALTSEFAANHMYAMDMAHEMFSPKEIELSEQWYFRANSTAVYLEEQTGINYGYITAVMSGISMQTAWAPDNIVGSTHVVIRLGRPELDPNSPEYRQVFTDAMNAGGWGHDLLNEAPKDLAERFAGDQQAAIAYYADVNNFLSKDGSSIRGVSMETQYRNAMLAAAVQIPPHMVVRMGKTNNFATSMAHPELPDPVTLDVHANAGMMGFDIEALGSKGTQGLGPAMKRGFTFADGEALTPEMIEEAKGRMREAGIDEQSIADWEKKARVPSPHAEARYEAMADGVRMARDARGYDQAHQAQAVGWHPIQKVRSDLATELQGLKRAPVKNSKKIERLRAKRVRNTEILDQLEGNPKYLASIPQMTANASSDLSSTIPDAVFDNYDLERKSFENPGSAIIMGSRLDGTVEVWARLDRPDALSEIDHLEPVVGMEVNGFTRMVPRTPQKVRSTFDKIEQLAEKGNGEATVYPGRSYPGHAAGDRFVFEFDDPDKAKAFAGAALTFGSVANLSRQVHAPVLPFKVYQQRVTHMDRTSGMNPIEDPHLIDVSTYLDPGRSPLIHNDWVAVSAAQTSEQSGITDPLALNSYNDLRHFELERELASAVSRRLDIPLSAAYGMVQEQQGVYQGQPSEKSFLVFGLPYSEALDIAKRFNQESIATRNALLYTDGSMEEATGQFFLGRDAEAQDFRSTTPVAGGQVTWSADYRYGERVDAGDVDMLMGRHIPGNRKMTQVVIDLGPQGTWSPWQITNELWRQGAQQANRSSAYLSGELHHEPSMRPLHEHVYDDGVSTAVWRTRPSTNSTKARTVYVPPDQVVGRPSGDEYRAARPMTHARRAALENPEAFKGAGVQVGDVTIRTPHSEAQLENTNRGILNWRLAFETQNGTVRHDITPYIDVESRTVTLSLNANPRAAGSVRVTDISDRRVTLETEDPNLFVPAAEIVQQLGYEVRAAKTLKYRAPDIDKNMGRPGHVDIGPLRQTRFDVIETENDLYLGLRYSSATGEKIRFSTGDVLGDGPMAGRLMDVLVGMSNPQLAPAWLKPLHEHGLTIPGHVLGTRGLPGGVHVATAQGMNSTIHGQTVSSGPFGARSIVLNARHAQAEAILGERVKEWNSFHADRHFNGGAKLPDGVGHMEYILLHEIGHAVLGYAEYGLKDWHSPDIDNDARMIVKQVKAVMEHAEVAHRVSSYAFDHAHEFFAETFAGVASGRVTDPTLVQMVRDVVDLVNQIEPRIR